MGKMEKSTLVYIDTNIFAAAALEQSTRGEAARKIIDALTRGHIKAATSALTWNEFVGLIHRELGTREASRAAKAFPNQQNINIIAVDRSVLSEAASSIENYNLLPQDAVHHATMKLKSINHLISEDKDFDSTGIKRYTAIGFSKMLET
jgi:predicted nucleic acid-binding protein